MTLADSVTPTTGKILGKTVTPAITTKIALRLTVGISLVAAEDTPPTRREDSTSVAHLSAQMRQRVKTAVPTAVLRGPTTGAEARTVGITVVTDGEAAMGTTTGGLLGLAGPEAEEAATAHVAVDVATEGACWNTLYSVTFQFFK